MCNCACGRKRRRSAKMVVTPARRRWNRAVKLVSIFLGWVTCTLCMPAFCSICWVYMLILFAFDRCYNAETPGRSSTWIRSLLSELYDTGVFFFFQFWILNWTFSALLINWIKLLQFPCPSLKWLCICQVLCHHKYLGGGWMPGGILLYRDIYIVQASHLKRDIIAH